MSVAVSDIETRSLVLADLQNAAYITQYDRHAAINEGYRYLYNILMDSDDDYYVTEVITAVTSAYNFPADFLRLRAVDCSHGAIYTNVRKYTMEERNLLDNPITIDPMYREFNNTLRLIPQGRTFNLRIWYYPVASTLISSNVLAWVTGTAYTQGNMVSNSGTYYVAVSNHTAAALFSTDLTAGKWSIFSTSGTSTISYPNNLVHEIIAYKAAILYRIKHKAQEGLLQELRVELANLEKQFNTQIIRDDYKNEKIQDVWSGRRTWL